MYIDFKETVWVRVEIDDEYQDNALELLMDDAVVSRDDFVSFCEDPNLTAETIPGTRCSVSPVENDGYCTIEAYEDDGEKIFSNGK